MAQESNRYSGRFWLASEESPQTVGGWLDLSGRWPALELAEPLSPAMREVSRSTFPDGSTLVQSQPADSALQPDGLTVHGLLRSGPRRVTLVGATSAGRKQVFGGSIADPGEQRLRADYVLLGGHEIGGDALFTKARLRLRHLDAWAQLSGIEVQVVGDGSRVEVVYLAPEPETAKVPSLAGRLVLDGIVPIPEPTVRGATVTRIAELKIEVSDGLSLDTLWRRFVSPLATLLTLAVDRSCPPVSLDVYSEREARWLEVRRPELREPPDDLLQVHEVLLTRMNLGLGHLAAWLERAPQLRPIPSLVAEVATAPDRTLARMFHEAAVVGRRGGLG